MKYVIKKRGLYLARLGPPRKYTEHREFAAEFTYEDVQAAAAPDESVWYEPIRSVSPKPKEVPE